jgi:hypothetical protein
MTSVKTLRFVDLLLKAEILGRKMRKILLY